MKKLRAHKVHRPYNGAAMVIVLTMIILLSLIGIWNLTSSTNSLRIAGHYSKGLQVEQQAETAIRLAAQRLREIADPTKTDSLRTRGLYEGDAHDLNWLIDGVLQEGTCTLPDPVCPETFQPAEGLDDADECSVICNFMGTVVPEQVMVARKKDVVKDGVTSAIFLLTSISKDAVGRRKVRFGVMTIPYTGTSGAWEIPMGNEPTLAMVLNSNF